MFTGEITLSIAKKHLTTLVEIDIIKVLNVERSRKSCFLVEPFRKIKPWAKRFIATGRGIK